MLNNKQQAAQQTEEIAELNKQGNEETLALLALQMWASGEFDLENWGYSSEDDRKETRRLAKAYGAEIETIMSTEQVLKGFSRVVANHIIALKFKSK
jgi:predicted kinase